jgi:mRNA interferase RelE/StbE
VYEVLLERRAERDLKALAEDPKPPGSRKIVGSKSDWRIRIGDYRVIYEIEEQAKAVKVMRIRHRKEAYR